MSTLLQDVRYALRGLVNRPGVTAAAVFILALGFGVNTSIFNLLDAILIRPLPGIGQPERLVLMGRTVDGRGFDSLSYPNYLDLGAGGTAFQSVAAYSHRFFNLSVAGETVRVPGAVVSANYLEVLGVDIPLGRGLQPESGDAAVISHTLWRRAYDSDPAVLGRTATVNGRALTIVGVTPAGFVGSDIREPPLDIWIPIGSPAQTWPSPALSPDRGTNWLSVIGRLKPGVAPSRAQADASGIARQLQQAYPRENRGMGVAVAPYHALGGGDARRDTSRMLALLLAVTVLVLLVACANVAGLLLAQASTRGREVAIRLSLGAGRGRLVRQFFVEGLVLSVVACAAGLAISVWTADLLPQLFPVAEGVRPALDLSPGFPLVMYALSVAAASSIVFSLLPALQASTPAAASNLKTGQGTAAWRGSRVRDGLAVLQVALSVVVLAAAGLLARSLQTLHSIDPLMRTDGLLLASLDPALNGYDEAAAKRFYQQLLERAGGLPGVESASFARLAPFSNSGMSLGPVRGGIRRDGPGLGSDCNLVGPDYFRTLGITVVRGREFGVTDREGAPRVAIVNETLARRLWPGADPLGQTMRLAGESGEWTVAGVARDSRYRSATEPPRPFLYLPALQFTSPVFSNRLPAFTLHLRVGGDPLGLVGPLRRLVREMDPNLPLYNVRTARGQLDSSFWPWRMAATLVGFFSLMAVAMATVGLYAVTAYRVSRRTAEIGVRMALGATPREVLASTASGGMRLAAAGLAAGIPLALAGTRVLTAFLYGVTAADFLTYAGVSVLLLATAMVACYLPARRATRVDPNVALRYE